MKNKRQKTNKNSKLLLESLDTKIAKAVYAEKKISERIIGYYPYELQFVKATYFGTTQRPAKISAIEKGIVGILLIDGHSSFSTIGQILGLDVVNDKAEKSILSKALDGLRSFNAIEGDDDYIAVKCMLTKVNVLTHTKSLLTYLWTQTMLIGKLLKMHCLQ